MRLAGETLTVEVQGARARVPEVVPERRVLFGGRAPRRAGSLFLDAVSVAAPAANSPTSPPANAAPKAPTATRPLAVPTSGGAAPSVGPGGLAPGMLARPFAAGSFWNAPLAADAPLDAASGTLVAELRRQLDLGAPWINTTSYSTPVFRVGPDQPTVRVRLDVANAALQNAWNAVPVPADARAATGTDKHMVIWQPATDTMWEFWQMQRDPDGTWHARWGGRVNSVSRHPGYYAGAEKGWGSSATGLPLLGGLITLDDMRAGRIDHALGLAIPEARKDWFTWPAQRTDGKKADPNAIPEGARFRLDPTLDLTALKLYPIVRLMAEAAQRYGIVVRDQSGVVAFAGEDPTPTGTNPWSGPGGYFSNQYPSTLMRQFPWQHLQALRTNQQCCGTA
jgi:hypothetical protein